MHVETDKIKVYADGTWIWLEEEDEEDEEEEPDAKRMKKVLKSVLALSLFKKCEEMIIVLLHDLYVQATRCKFSNVVLVLGEEGETEQVNNL